MAIIFMFVAIVILVGYLASTKFIVCISLLTIFGMVVIIYKKRYWLLLQAVVGILIGLACVSYHRQQGKNTYANQIGRRVVVIGEVESIPKYIHHRWQFIFKGELKHSVPVCNILTYWYGKQINLRAGDRWRLAIKLSDLPIQRNPVTFDYHRWLMVQAIGLRGVVINAADNQLLDRGKTYHSLLALRQAIAVMIKHGVTNPSIAATLVALTTGSRYLLKQQDWRVFQNTGTSHLIAISGLHVSLVAGLFYGLIKWIFSRIYRLSSIFPAQRIAACLALMAGFFYALLSGFSLPTQRAFIMLAVVLGAELLDRHLPMWYRLLCAFACILFFWPRALYSCSFWLSFFAVTVLSLSVSRGVRRKLRIGTWLELQCGVFIGLIPLTLYYFKRLSLVSIVANAVAIPYVSFVIVPLCLFSTISTIIFGSLTTYAWYVVGKCMAILWWYLSWLASKPYVVWYHSIGSITALMTSVLATFVFLLPRKFPAKWLAIIFYLPLFLWQPKKLSMDQARVTVFDVGNRAMIVIETRHHAMAWLDHINHPYQLYELSDFLQAKVNANLSIMLLQSTLLGRLQLTGRLAQLSNVGKVFLPADGGFALRRLLLGWHWDGFTLRLLKVSTAAGRQVWGLLLFNRRHRIALLPGLASTTLSILINQLKPELVIFTKIAHKLNCQQSKILSKNQVKYYILSGRYNKWRLHCSKVSGNILPYNHGYHWYSTHRDGAITIKIAKAGVIRINGYLLAQLGKR